MEQKLPESARNCLAGAGIAEADILSAALGDLDTGSSYRDFLLVLTKDKLLLLQGEAARRTRDFAADEIPDRFEGAKTLIFGLDEFETLELEHRVSGGLAVLKTNEGEKVLFGYSSHLGGALRVIKKLLTKLKAGDEILPGDLKPEELRERCPKCGGLYPDKNRKICPRCIDRRSVFLRMMSRFRPYRGKLVLMMVCILANTLLGLMLPYLSGTVLYDGILIGKKLPIMESFGGRLGTMLLLLVLTMAALKLLSQTFGMIQSRLVAQIVPRVLAKLKSDIFDSMGRLSVRYYAGRQTGSLMTRVLEDANEVTSFFIDGLPYLFINGLTILIAMVILFGLNWKLALVAAVLLPVLTLISAKLGPIWWGLFGKRHRASRSLNAQVADNIAGARVVKGFGQEAYELRRFGRYNRAVKDVEMEFVKFENWFYSIFRAVEELTNLLVSAAGAYLILGPGELEFGLLMSFLGYVGMLKGPMDFMSFIFRWWNESLNSAQRMFEIIDSVPDISEPEHPVPLEELKGEVELRDVSFSYEPGKYTLEKISFRVRPGEMLGIVGKSGAGKSTLVNLISRLYDPDEGSIYIDGVNIRDLSFADLRRSIALVSQETYIFVGTVAENIAYGAPGATREEILMAARAAFAHDFIAALPDGYDTMIGTGGRELSGGERQRLSIARAILVNPNILILDEATASVDTQTERNIEKALTQLSKNRTTLSIAHRLSTLRSADRLIVLENGKLTEEGTHGELVEKKGAYFKLMEMQNKALALRGISG